MKSLFYVDPNDPATMVEARWGIGYTMNLGNRMAQVFVGVFLLSLLGLAVMTMAVAGLFQEVMMLPNRMVG